VGEEPNHSTAREPGPLYTIYFRLPALTRMLLVAFLIVQKGKVIYEEISEWNVIQELVFTFTR
jgi:hypothetical protein